MPRIGNKRDGMAEKSIDNLNDHDHNIQPDRDLKTRIRGLAGGCVMMVVMRHSNETARSEVLSLQAPSA